MLPRPCVSNHFLALFAFEVTRCRTLKTRAAAFRFIKRIWSSRRACARRSPCPACRVSHSSHSYDESTPPLSSAHWKPVTPGSVAKSDSSGCIVQFYVPFVRRSHSRSELQPCGSRQTTATSLLRAMKAHARICICMAVSNPAPKAPDSPGRCLFPTPASPKSELVLMI
jgi:hypothetical protein